MRSDKDSEEVLSDEEAASFGSIRQNYVWTRKKVLTAPQATSTPIVSNAGKTKGKVPCKGSCYTYHATFFNHNVLSTFSREQDPK